MTQETVRVLLISETEHGCSNLRRLMESRGCHCWFGGSFDEAASFFDQHSFHLVLSTIPFHRYDRLLAKLSGLPSTVYQGFQVEDGCWWLPLARNGKECLGAPALRASEFLRMFEHLVEEIQLGREVASSTGS